MGVVRDFGLDPDDDGNEQPHVFRAASARAVSPLVMSVRMRGNPATLAPRLPVIAAGVDARLLVHDSQPMEEWIRQRDQFLILTVGAQVAVTLLILFLSARGIFSLESVRVSRRTREMGLRAVLGATPPTGSILPVSVPPAPITRYNVNLPVASPAGSIALAILGNDYLVDLELSALQAEGDGRVVSSPRIVATNQREARILQGTEIPYQESSSSGAATVSFKEAVLSLTVIPQITPDDHIIMDLTVTKDSVGELVPSGGAGGFIPSIDKRELVTQVVVSDGETVVLGGVYETELRNVVTKVPGLGNLPAIGYLFRSKSTTNNNAELLIFVTPKIIRNGNRVN